ncbi:hypothetical protein K438DRAFT_1754399 [Mycena galopus ATCC 62051]|nr:hypothetical protein K438DRAFT_1754399 [Mycena galopus ATCC 62051]
MVIECNLAATLDAKLIRLAYAHTTERAVILGSRIRIGDGENKHSIQGEKANTERACGRKRTWTKIQHISSFHNHIFRIWVIVFGPRRSTNTWKAFGSSGASERGPEREDSVAGGDLGEVDDHGERKILHGVDEARRLGCITSWGARHVQLMREGEKEKYGSDEFDAMYVLRILGLEIWERALTGTIGCVDRLNGWWRGGMKPMGGQG